MGTVTKGIADRIIERGGWGDEADRLAGVPRVVEITEYDNAWGGVGYGLTSEGERNVYAPSEYVRNPRRYWPKDPEPQPATTRYQELVEEGAPDLPDDEPIWRDIMRTVQRLLSEAYPGQEYAVDFFASDNGDDDWDDPVTLVVAFPDGRDAEALADAVCAPPEQIARWLVDQITGDLPKPHAPDSQPGMVIEIEIVATHLVRVRAQGPLDALNAIRNADRTTYPKPSLTTYRVTYAVADDGREVHITVPPQE